MRPAPFQKVPQFFRVFAFDLPVKFQPFFDAHALAPFPFSRFGAGVKRRRAPPVVRVNPSLRSHRERGNRFVRRKV